MGIKEFFDEKIEPIIKGLASFFVLVYSLGFLVWNIYLSQFGFFESSFIQMRFLSTGILFVIISTYPILILYGLFYQLYKINWINELMHKNVSQLLFEVFISMLSILFLLYFSLILFPIFPQYFGGARPFAKSIIADSKEIDFLSNLNMDSAPNREGQGSIQTGYLCEIYNNNDVTIVGTSGGGHLRVIIFRKELFKGFQVVPLFVENMVRESKCNLFVGRSMFWPFLP